jgi:hypothetical protein
MRTSRASNKLTEDLKLRKKKKKKKKNPGRRTALKQSTGHVLR